MNRTRGEKKRARQRVEIRKADILARVGEIRRERPVIINVKKVDDLRSKFKHFWGRNSGKAE